MNLLVVFLLVNHLTLSWSSSFSSHSSSNSSRRKKQHFHHAIPVNKSPTRVLKAFFAQQEHHRQRRLHLEEEKRRRRERQRRTLSSEQRNNHLRENNVQKENDNDIMMYHYRHARDWRRVLSSSTTRTSMATRVELANCHLVMWNGVIGLGTPSQQFLVDFDTASPDIWVPSSKCDASCDAFPDWKHFTQHQSSTYEIASDDPSQNSFDVEYEDGESVHGLHAKDVLVLGSSSSDDDEEEAKLLTIPNQVFAQVTSVYDFATCEAEEGVLGLAMDMVTSKGFPTLMSNLNTTLKYGMYSLYLNPMDDYPAEHMPFVSPDPNTGNMEYGAQRPNQFTSELVLGGVNQLHYLGCLTWHDLMDHSTSTLTGENNDGSTTTFSGYWDFALTDVKVGGVSVTKDDASSDVSTLVGLLDSGSSYLVGPAGAVAHIVTMNNAKCFNIDPIQQTDPTPVDCSSGTFDAAIIDCDEPFFNLEFIADGVTYVLEKEDLVLQVQTSNNGAACILRLVGSEGIPGWVLGDVFLNKYYAAFDFRNKRIGLALATEHSADTCETDWPMDIHNNDNDNDNTKDTPPVPSDATTVAPTVAAAASAPSTTPTVDDTSSKQTTTTVAPSRSPIVSSPTASPTMPPVNRHEPSYIPEEPLSSGLPPPSKMLTQKPMASDEEKQELIHSDDLDESFDFTEVAPIDPSNHDNMASQQQQEQAQAVGGGVLGALIVIIGIVSLGIYWKRHKQRRSFHFQDIIAREENTSLNRKSRQRDPDGSVAYVWRTHQKKKDKLKAVAASNYLDGGKSSFVLEPDEDHEEIDFVLNVQTLQRMN